MGYTYVLSDVHGHLDCFESVLAQINLQPDDTLYVLGDVIDRGAHGIAILRKIMAMPNARMLLGNHEFMMLNALGEPYDGKRRNVSDSCELWYGNGGGITHIAWFCLPNEQKAEMLKEARAKAGEEYQRIVADARSEADKILSDAKILADREQEKRMQQTQNQIAELVVAAAAKLVASKTSEEEDKELYNQFITKTGGLE